MDEVCLGLRTQKFRKGDHVAVASRAAVCKIRITAPVRDFDKSLCFDKVGTVESVMPTGEVGVTFAEGIRCAIPPEALLKVPNLFPGALVKLVDDIRGDGNLKLPFANTYISETKPFGGICTVLKPDDDFPDIIKLRNGEAETKLHRFHLDFVATPLHGNSRYFQESIWSGEYRLFLDFQWRAGHVFEALQDSMGCLDDVDTSSGSAPARYRHGDVVTLSADVTDGLKGLKLVRETNFARSSGVLVTAPLTRRMEPFPELCGIINDLSYKCGKVVEGNSDGDVIVRVVDGGLWRIRPSFLEIIQCSDKCSKDKLSGQVDRLVRDTLRIQNVKSIAAALNGYMFTACYSGNTTLLEHCLGGHAGVNSEDLNGNKPLHYAAHWNQPEIIKILLNSGADINAINNRHYTALQFSVKEGFVNCVRELTTHHDKLNPNIQDDSGNTALHVAIAKRNAEIVNELLNLPEVDVCITNTSGFNALHVTALKGNAVVVEKILSRRYDLVNVKQRYTGYAALHFAAVSGHYKVVETLLMQDTCTVDIENNDEVTPLLLAAREGHWDIVELLVLAGANIKKTDRHGNTPLHISLQELNGWPVQHLDVPTSRAIKAVEKKILQCDSTSVDSRLRLPCFLARCGADIRCCNKEGKTPLDIASSLKQPAVELLGFFHVERRDALPGKCKICLEATANTCFTPCGHCLYCDDCGLRMKRCLTCGKTIAERTLSGPSTTSDDMNKKIEVRQAREWMCGPKIYSMTRNPRGMCIIINNVDFDTLFERREGSELDVRRMKALFSQLHFQVTVASNLSADGMKQLLTDASKADSHKDADGLVVILMSHGKKGVVYGSDCEELHLERDVYNPFYNDSCPKLQGKPKLFFVQACRGSEWDSGTVDVRETSDSPQATTEHSGPTFRQPANRIPNVSDMYIAYATIPGYVALKNAQKGSWFLSAVSEVFSKHACTTSLTGLMCDVHKMVMECSTHDGSKQTPSIEKHGWTKELYFNPGLHV